MEITVTKEAQAWFEREMGVSPQRGVRFLAKYMAVARLTMVFRWRLK